MSKKMTSEKLLRAFRVNAFEYENDEKLGRVIEYLKVRVSRKRVGNGKVGKWSGMTKSEIFRSGTCETDWF